MTTKELVNRLTYYNQWRRGVSDDQPSPVDIGQWIEKACEKLIEMEQQLDEASSKIDQLIDEGRDMQDELGLLRLKLEQTNDNP